MSRRTSQKGIAFIKQWEGVRPVVYRDAVGLPTVGVGHLLTPSDPWKVGDRIPDDEIERLLREDLRTAEAVVERAVRVPIDDDQFAALVSLAFNIGTGAFARSTLVKRLNAGDYAAAAGHFGDWKKAGGKVLKGLVRRRAAEADLFCGPDNDPLPARAEEPAAEAIPPSAAVEVPVVVPEPSTASSDTTTINVAEAGSVNVADSTAAPVSVVPVPGGGPDDPAVRADKDSLQSKFKKWFVSLFGGFSVAGAVTGATQIGQVGASLDPFVQRLLAYLFIAIIGLGVVVAAVGAIIWLIAFVRDHEKTKENRADPEKVNAS